MASIYSRQNILTLYLPTLTLALGQGIAVPALPVFARSFGVSFGVASTVLVAFAIGGLIAGLPAGYLVDRIGRRKMIIAGPVIIALTSFLAAAAQSFPELLLYRTLAGAGQQMWNITRVTMVADSGTDQQRGRQMTTITALQNLGQIMGPAVGGLIAALWDVRVPFVFYGALALLSTLPGSVLARDLPLHRRGHAATTTSTPGWGWIWAGALPVFFLALFFAGLSRGALFNGTLNVYAVYAYDVGPDTVGFMAGAAGAIGIPITLGSGAVMDRFGRKASIVPGFILIGAALGVMVATAAFGWGFGVFVAIFIALQAALTITSGSLQVLGADLVPAEVRGRFFGVWQTVNQMGFVLSPSLFALLTEALGPPWGFAFLAVTALVVAALIGPFVPDPIRRNRLARRSG